VYVASLRVDRCCSQGTAWRLIQQGFIDMEKMFQLLDVEPEIKDACDASQVR
jgi:ABC-type transport system involved in Fe-S cluster assembly fused permease/ATPase subunit